MQLHALYIAFRSIQSHVESWRRFIVENETIGRAAGDP
jgi:hypothetical protein